MADGVRLAATLYLPDGEGPWPALLEALPYRKDDLTAVATGRSTTGSPTSSATLVCRLDVRGTGSSDGVPVDEYTRQEHADIGEVIAWLAIAGLVERQRRDVRHVVVRLQLAAGRDAPSAGAARRSVRSSRPTIGTRDDVHYFGGALKQLDLVDYPTYMDARNVLPPVPRIARERMARARGSGGSMVRALDSRRGSSTRRTTTTGSTARSARTTARSTAPTMLVTGWADGYTNIALRGVRGARVPEAPARRPVGARRRPRPRRPGPNVDLVPEMARWWDRWLKGVDNGVDREPPIVLFVRRPDAPGGRPRRVPRRVALRARLAARAQPRR